MKFLKCIVNPPPHCYCCATTVNVIMMVECTFELIIAFIIVWSFVFFMLINRMNGTMACAWILLQ